MWPPPVTKSAQVTWYKQAKGVQPGKMHPPHASSLEEKSVPTTSHNHSHTRIRINEGLSLPSPTACVAGTLGVSKAPQLLRGV